MLHTKVVIPLPAAARWFCSLVFTSPSRYCRGRLGAWGCLGENLFVLGSCEIKSSGRGVLPSPTTTLYPTFSSPLFELLVGRGERKPNYRRRHRRLKAAVVFRAYAPCSRRMRVYLLFFPLIHSMVEVSIPLPSRCDPPLFPSPNSLSIWGYRPWGYKIPLAWAWVVLGRSEWSELEKERERLVWFGVYVCEWVLAVRASFECAWAYYFLRLTTWLFAWNWTRSSDRRTWAITRDSTREGQLIPNSIARIYNIVPL